MTFDDRKILSRTVGQIEMKVIRDIFMKEVGHGINKDHFWFFPRKG
jgi:hypothetical protein